MMKWSALYTQDSISNTAYSLNSLMDWVTVMMLSILISTFWFIMSIMKNKIVSNMIIEHRNMEFMWTSLPMVILCFMASVSLKSLYTEENLDSSPCMNLNITGHQWYWEYYYPDFNLNFDSYMKEWESSMFRLSDCDNRVVLPMSTPIRISVTSDDVIHSWAVPSLGIKMDATPGRILSTMHKTSIPGLVYGMCAELCGANHSFMPITIEHCSLILFKNWVFSMIETI